VLEPCCSAIEHMGPVGMGATTKLISNFLSLGTATLVMEAMRGRVIMVWTGRNSIALPARVPAIR